MNDLENHPVLADVVIESHAQFVTAILDWTSRFILDVTKTSYPWNGADAGEFPWQNAVQPIAPHFTRRQMEMSP